MRHYLVKYHSLSKTTTLTRKNADFRLYSQTDPENSKFHGVHGVSVTRRRSLW